MFSLGKIKSCPVNEIFPRLKNKFREKTRNKKEISHKQA